MTAFETNSRLVEFAPDILQSVEIPQTDVYAQFGHSVVQGQRDWYPTRLLQTVTNKMDDIDQETGYPWYERTGKAEPTGNDTTNVVVGGGAFVTAAMADAYTILAGQGKAPRLVIHSGGRPKYLEASSPEISEGGVMQRAFNTRLNVRGIPLPPQRVIDTTRTTTDDIRYSLDAVLEAGGTSVTFVGLGLRFDRFMILYQNLREETDKYNGIEVYTLFAEAVLRAKALQLGRGEQFDAQWDNFTQSEGYKRTLAMEQAGIRKLAEGNYGKNPNVGGRT